MYIRGYLVLICWPGTRSGTTVSPVTACALAAHYPCATAQLDAQCASRTNSLLIRLSSTPSAAVYVRRSHWSEQIAQLSGNVSGNVLLVPPKALLESALNVSGNVLSGQGSHEPGQPLRGGAGCGCAKILHSPSGQLLRAGMAHWATFLAKCHGFGDSVVTGLVTLGPARLCAALVHVPVFQFGTRAAALGSLGGGLRSTRFTRFGECFPISGKS